MCHSRRTTRSGADIWELDVWLGCGLLVYSQMQPTWADDILIGHALRRTA